MTWSAGDNTAGYIIYRQDTETVISLGRQLMAPAILLSKRRIRRIIYVGNGSSYTDDYELEDNKTYMYKIFSYNSSASI